MGRGIDEMQQGVRDLMVLMYFWGVVVGTKRCQNVSSESQGERRVDKQPQ